MPASTLPLDLAAAADLAWELWALDREALGLALHLDSHTFCAFAATAMGLGLSIGQALALMLPRVHTGYMPRAQRMDVAHRAYSDGLRTPPRRMRAEDRAKAEAARWGLRGAA